MEKKEVVDAIFTHTTEGILLTNEEGLILHSNKSAEKMFGYETDELIGQKIEILIPQRVRHNHVSSRENFNKQPSPRSMGAGMNLFAKRKDDSEFAVEISLSPYTKNDETFVIAFIIDITVRKKIEDEVKEKKKELELLAMNLKESNKELENFAYISSHDLQEPLRKIQSFGDRLKTVDGENFSEKGKDYLERILNASARMQNLISDLLAFSRLSNKDQVLSKFDLNEIMESVLSDLEVNIEKTGTKINVEKLPTIDAEPTQIRQLFQNLISNAIKFRKEDESPVINIYSKPSETKDKTIDIFFEDNGIGFNEKYLDKIFNIFQRLEGQKYEGSGMGLAICRKIALFHGGDLTAESEVGKGSTFIVTLAIKQTKKNEVSLHPASN